jgi:iron complex outermembrane receptor protein
MKSIKKVITLIMVVFVCTAWSQDSNFKIIDTDQKPLTGATFVYETQSGISDITGTINFDYIAGQSMKLSYLGYGQWEMTDAMILDAIEDGQFIKEAIVNNLQPITVISMRPKTAEETQMVFDFQAKMAHDGGDLLTNTPAISGIRKGGNYGLDPVMRGFKYDQLNIVMNGAQSATAACPNRMDPPTSQMAPNMLDRVEIFKGPHALRYGGGLGGTINYVTGDPTFYLSTEAYGRVSGRYDSNGDILRSEAMVGLGGKKYNVGLFGSWATGDDYNDGSNRIIPADFQRSSFGIKAGLLPTSNQTIEVSAFINQAKDVDFPALMMDLRSDKTIMINGTHKINFDNKALQNWTTTVFLSDVDHLMDNKLKPLDPRMMDAKTDAITTNYGIRTEGIWKIGKSKIYAGADYKVEEAQGVRERHFLLGPMKGNKLFDNAWQNGQIQKGAIFSEYNFSHAGWQLVVAGRLEMNNAKVIDADPIFIEQYPDTEVNQINPSISIGGLKEIKEGVAVGLWAARAQRSASLAERYINKFSIGQDPYEMIGNPNLSPEVNNQLDFTFEWRTKSSAINVDLFGAYMQNFISSVIDPSVNTLLPNSPGVRRFINVDNALKTGIEVSYNHQINSWLSSDLAMAYTYAQDLDREEPLPEIAPLDARIGLSGIFFSGTLRPRLAARFVADQKRVSVEYGEIETPDFFLLNFDLDYAITNNWKFQAGINNILDVTYYEHLTRSTAGANPLPLNAAGRNLFVACNFTF